MIVIEDNNVLETRCESDHITIKVKSFENINIINTDKGRSRAEKLEIWGNFMVELLSHHVIEKHKLTADEKRDLSIFTKNSLIKIL